MNRTLIALLAAECLFALAAPAEEFTAQQIVDKANRAAYYAGGDGRAEVRMVITDAGGGQRVREFTILRLNADNGDQKFYIYFQAPADVRKMAYLVWKNIGAGRDDDRWLWLPALNLARRIAPGDKRTSFVGSDFVYEDVSGAGTPRPTTIAWWKRPTPSMSSRASRKTRTRLSLSRTGSGSIATRSCRAEPSTAIARASCIAE